MSSVFDVLVITTAGFAGTPGEIRAKEAQYKGNMDLDGTVEFKRLPESLAEKVINAWRLPNCDYHPPLPQQVSIVRRDPPDPQLCVWDSDRKIYGVLATSRLVQPTCIGLRYAARVGMSEGGNVQQVVPASIFWHMADAFCARGERWYITEQDALRIREVLPKNNWKAFPARVQRALWYFDYVFYQYYTPLRWLLLCIAMEALVHTDIRASTRQFYVRVAALAAQAGVGGWSEDKLKDIYGRYRSAVSHGGPSPYPPVPKDMAVGGLPPALVKEYVEFEDLVRQVLLHCVEDQAFRQEFSKDQTIQSNWPV